MKLIPAFLLLVALAGCAAALVPETSDPARKLGWARELINNQNRPIPAERLIKEALTIYQAEQNELGEADANRTLAEFYKSDAYANNAHYKATTEYPLRYKTAIGYYNNALALYVKNGELFGASNETQQTGLLYAEENDIPSACKAFDEGLDYHNRGMGAHPETKVRLPKEFASFKDGIAYYKNKIGCPQ